MRQRFGIGEQTTGAVIVATVPESIAAASELRSGDVTVMVDKAKVEHPRDVADAISKRTGGRNGPPLLLIEREGRQRFIALATG